MSRWGPEKKEGGRFNKKSRGGTVKKIARDRKRRPVKNQIEGTCYSSQNHSINLGQGLITGLRETQIVASHVLQKKASKGPVHIPN